MNYKIIGIFLLFLTIPLHANKKNKECIICFEEINSKDSIVLPCSTKENNHIYHFHCLKEWQKNQSNCPYCRTPFETLTKQKHSSDKSSFFKYFCIGDSNKDE